MAVLERVPERLLRSSFVDIGTGTLGSSMYLFRLPNLVSFFCKNEGKRRSVIAFKIVIGLCYISHLCHEHNSNGF